MSVQQTESGLYGKHKENPVCSIVSLFFTRTEDHDICSVLQPKDNNYQVSLLSAPHPSTPRKHNYAQGNNTPANPYQPGRGGGGGGGGSGSWRGIERRTRDRKFAGSSPGRSSGTIFFSRVNLLCRLLFLYPFHPRVSAVAIK